MINIILDPDLKPKDDLSNVHPKVYCLYEEGKPEVWRTASGEEVKFIYNGTT